MKDIFSNQCGGIEERDLHRNIERLAMAEDPELVAINEKGKKNIAELLE